MSQRPANSTEPRPRGAREPKLWKCGDPYRYPIPKPDGDPWDILLQPFLKKDDAQCEAWKNEIHYLLIFAGLFSVVMSIFVLHSTQSLQQNSNDVSANMLAIIANSLNNIALNGSVAGGQTPANVTSAALFFVPSRSHVRVSILWFISLILSLATLIVGIVILQWIKEHQRYTDDITSKEAVAVYHMRVEAWKKWRVPQIISGLPALLLISVILFFAGVIVYLFTINRTVAITVTVIIGITLFFLLITTLLPTLQCFVLTLSEPSRKKAIPTQCPYKSPQSWIFYRLFEWIFRYTFSLGWNLRYIPIAFFVQQNRYSWMMFDSWWLTLRSTYSQFIHGVFTPSSDSVDPQSPGYDESQILVQTMQKHSETSKIVLAAYYCFQDVSQTALRAQDDKELEDLNSSLRKRNQLLHLQYWNGEQYGKRTAASNRLDTSNVQKMHDENMMLFLWLPGNRTYSDPIARGLASHMLELQSRKLGYTMVQGSLEDACFADDREALWMARIYQQYKPTNGAQNVGPWTQALHRRISKDVAEASVEQFFLIFHSFIRKYASEAGQAWTLTDLQTNVHGRVILQNFLAIPSTLSGQLFSTSESWSISLFKSTLAFIATALDTSWMHTQLHERHDFLFFSVTYFLTCLFPSGMKTIQPGDPEIPLDLLRSLSRYEETVDKTVWSAIFTGNYNIGDWSARLLIIESIKTLELHGSKKLLVQSITTQDNQKSLGSQETKPLLGQSAQPLENHTSHETRDQFVQSNPPPPEILIQFDSEDPKVLQSQTTGESQSFKSQDLHRIKSEGSQVRLDALNTQRSDSQATQRFPTQDDQTFTDSSNVLRSNPRVGQFVSQDISFSESRDMRGFDLQENGEVQSQNIVASESRDVQIFNSQDNGYFQSRDVQRLQAEKRFNSQDNRNFQSETMQRYDSNSSQQFDSSNTQRFESNDTQQFDSSFNQIFQSQDHRLNSFSSSRYDSTERSWMERTHNRGESWSSRMMDQSVRSSKSVGSFEHEAVDGNLFY